jgi:hypothetical protein
MGFGFRVLGLGFFYVESRVLGLDFRGIRDSAFKVFGFGFSVQGFRILGLGVHV